MWGFVCLAFGAALLEWRVSWFSSRLLRPGGRPSTCIARFRQREGELERAVWVSAYCPFLRGQPSISAHSPSGRPLATIRIAC